MQTKSYHMLLIWMTVLLSNFCGLLRGTCDSREELLSEEMTNVGNLRRILRGGADLQKADHNFPLKGIQDYDYWLTQADIALIANHNYKNFGTDFDVVGKMEQFEIQLDRFAKDTNTKSSTFIINLEDFDGSPHWVTLVLNKEGDNIRAYYADSLSASVPEKISRGLETILPKDNIFSVSSKQQHDGSSCGIFALKNAEIINEDLKNGQSLKDMVENVKTFKPTREQLQEIRNKLSKDLERFPENEVLRHSGETVKSKKENFHQQELIESFLQSEDIKKVVGNDNKLEKKVPDIENNPKEFKLKDFSEDLALIIREIPHMPRAPTDFEFWRNVFLGGSEQLLQSSDLKARLGIREILTKNEEGTLKLAFFLEKDGQKSLVLNTVTSDQTKKDYGFTEGEVKEIAKKWEIGDENPKIISKTYLIDQKKRELSVGDFSEKVQQLLKKETEISSISEDSFKKITSALDQSDPESDFRMFLGSEPETASGKTKGIFNEFKTSYDNVHKTLSLTKSNTVTLYGYLFGSLKLVYKNRFSLDISYRLISGKGIPGLMFISRIDGNNNKNWNAIPVVINLDFGKKLSVDGIDTMIKKGFHENIPLRSVSDKAVMVEINPSKVETRTVDVPKYEGVFKEILNPKRSPQVIETRLQGLYNSYSNYVAKSKESSGRYMSQRLLMEILTSKSEWQKTLYYNKGMNSKVYALSNEKSKEKILLNVIDSKSSAINRKVNLPNDWKEGPIIKIDVDVRPEKLTVKEKLFSTIEEYKNTNNWKLNGEFKNIKSLDMDNNLKVENSIDSFMKQINEMVKDFKGLIKTESDVQGLLQGAFSRNDLESDGERIRTFTELNLLKDERLDLLVHQLKVDKNGIVSEKDIFLIECKYLKKGDLNSELSNAFIQAEKYTKNVNKITDLEKLTYFSVVFDSKTLDFHASDPGQVRLHQIIPPNLPEVARPSVDENKRPSQNDLDDTQKTKRYCGPGSRRRKRSALGCVYQLKHGVDPNSETIKSHHIEKVYAEEFLKDVMAAPEKERQHLIELASQGEIAGNEKTKNVVREFLKTNKIRSSAEKLKKILKKTETGDLIHDLLSPTGNDLKDVVISPKTIAEAADNANLKKEMEPPKDVAPGKKTNFDAGYRAMKKINLGLMGKDLIGGILSGDEKSLLIMGGLVVGDKVLEGVGNYMINKGTKLVEASKVLKGNLLKVGGPIVGAATSGFQIYTLVSKVSQFRKLQNECQNKTENYEKNKCKVEKEATIAGIVGDSVSLAITTVMVTMQIVSLISAGLKALSVFSGPVGIFLLGLDILINIGTQIYSAVKQVEGIETLIKLTVGEKIREGFRGFFGMSPSDYLRILMQVKSSHNQITAEITEWLQKSSDFECYVLPSKELEEYNCITEWKSGYETDKGGCIALTIFTFGLGALECSKEEPSTKCSERIVDKRDSYVDLSSTSYSCIDRTNPDSSGRGEEIFCSLSSNDGCYHTAYTYTCKNAIGIRYNRNRRKRYVIIDLKDGDDHAIGKSDQTNIFLIRQGTKYFTGGHTDDMFILQEGPVFGKIDGNRGVDSLIINEEFMKSELIELDLLQDYATSSGTRYFQIFGINVIEGRKNDPEILIPDCDTKHVALNGGKVNSHDIINITDIRYCKYNMQILLSPYTRLVNFASTGEFHYIVPSSGHYYPENYLRGESVHIYHLEFDARDILNIDFDRGTRLLKLSNRQQLQFLHILKPIKTDGSIYSQPNFVTRDKLTIQVKLDGSIEGLILGNENSGSTVKGLKSFPNLIHVESGNQILYGGGKNDIFYLDKGPFNGRLYGDGGDDVFVVSNRFVPYQRITIDLSKETVSSSSSQFKVYGITSIVGRSYLGEDIIPNCYTKSIRGEGGDSKSYDRIVIQDRKCYYNLRAFLKRFTKITNSASSGNFIYEIDQNGSMEIFTISSSANHICLLPESAKQLDPVFHKKNRTLYFSRPKEDSVQMDISFSSGQEFHSQPRIVTSDHLEIRVTQEGAVQGLAYLNDDTPVASGLPNLSNTFVLQGGKKGLHAIGGNKMDTILLHDSPIKGSVDGLEGLDILILHDDFCNNQTVTIDFTRNLVTSPSGDSLHFSNVEAIVGRASAVEHVTVSCSTLSVDTSGGSDESALDSILIPYDEDCQYYLRITGREHTMVENSATVGTFLYEVPRKGPFSLDLTFTENTTHNFIFVNYLEEFTNIIFDKITERIHFFTKQGEILGQDLKPLELDQPFFTNPRFLTQDRFEIKISRLHNVVASSLTTLPPQEIISKFSELANDLSTNLLFFNNETQEIVHIGVNSTRSPDVLNNDPTLRSHLVGNGGENVYVITTNEEMLSGKDWLFSIPEVVIYGSNLEEKNILDLSLIVRPIREETGSDYSPETIQDGDDLCINLNYLNVKVTTIRLKNIISTESSITNFEIILNTAPMHLSFERSKKKRSLRWTLTPKPLEIDPTNELVLLTEDDIESGMKISVSNGNVSEFRFLLSDNNLISTNFFGNDPEENNFTTIVLQNYNTPFAEKASFSFPNGEVNIEELNFTESESNFTEALENKMEEVQLAVLEIIHPISPHIIITAPVVSLLTLLLIVVSLTIFGRKFKTNYKIKSAESALQTIQTFPIVLKLKQGDKCFENKEILKEMTI